MREAAKFTVNPKPGVKLIKAIPRRGGWLSTPFCDIGPRERAFFSNSVDVGKEVICWCFPTTSKGNITNYYALPISELDVINAMLLLNIYLSIREPDENFELASDAMAIVLDELRRLRPHKILGVEGCFVDERTMEFLASEGYSKGNPHLGIREVCYLGTTKLPDSHVFLAIGENGITYVNKINERYIGPIYVYGRAGMSDDTKFFKGYPIQRVTGEDRKGLIERYRDKKDTALDRLVWNMLFPRKNIKAQERR